MKITLNALLFLSFLTLPITLPADTKLNGEDWRPPTIVSIDTSAVVAANTSFALNLYAKLKTADGNLFFSPYSISTALAMTYGGARGETAQQMADTLGFSTLTNSVHEMFHALKSELDAVQKRGAVQLNIVNSIWPQTNYTFLDQYTDLLKWDYGVSVTPLDFIGDRDNACKTINSWVDANTNHKISDLIQPKMLNPYTRLVLANAVYFKGKWSSPFKSEATTEEAFHVNPSHDVKCKMMFQLQTFGYGETPDLQILKLPYLGNELFMLVLLPKKVNGIGAFETNLSPSKLTEWLGGLKWEKVAVSLPKFKQTITIANLKELLQKMGMTLAFKEGAADFSGMNGQHDLFISTIAHKAYVDVNEEGTEAAAVTAVMVDGSPGPPPDPIPTFQADHPFIFMIVDKNTSGILFLGRITDPTQ
jgi:serpin B